VLLLAHSSELTLPSHDEHRQRSTAREAAEALFRPKEPAVEPATSVAPEPVEQTARKPRVLAATPAPSQTKAPEPRVVAKAQPAAASIPPSHAARIRTWIKYGMTPRQIAALYRVEARDVRQVLREAWAYFFCSEIGSRINRSDMEISRERIVITFI
jgi:hypothetical protein